MSDDRNHDEREVLVLRAEDGIELPGGARGGNGSTGRVQLTSQQVDRVIEGGFQVAGDVVEIARNLVEIARIREQSRADVARVEADIARIESETRREVALAVERRKQTAAKGDAVVKVIREIKELLLQVPDLEPTARHALIAQIPPLVTLAVTNIER